MTFALTLKTARIASDLTVEASCHLFKPPIPLRTWWAWEQGKNEPNAITQATILKKLKEYTK
jgi:hypothetical protein